MPEIVWETHTVEPAHHGAAGAQLSVAVRGADSAWARRFNDLAAARYERGEVRGGRWAVVQYHEVEGLITVDDLRGEALEPIQDYLEELLRTAGR